MAQREGGPIIEDGLSRELVDEVFRSFNGSRFSKFVAGEILALGNGLCRVACPVSDDLSNSFDGAHGGALATLTDICMGLAVATCGLRAVTAELTVNYLAPAPKGEVLTAEGLVVHRGSTIILSECSIRSSSNRLITRGKGLYVDRLCHLRKENEI